MSGRKEQLIRTLSSRAETAPLSKPMFAAWLVAVVFVQFVWGLWAVCTRYMQVWFEDCGCGCGVQQRHASGLQRLHCSSRCCGDSSMAIFMHGLQA